ncbi:unnamed protein product [Cuscuta epithymum]|uniref:Uncharacterized protein n=1 Tax=Cuscuta epithymum TaxID=186058 RepID=A0AAV0C518_9ASTE|nr:unnamed protein product [Cuscuta epithymum]
MANPSRGFGRSESLREDFRANSHIRPANVLQSNDLHALPRLPRRARARRRLALHRLRQHHRLLHHLRPRHGYGAHLRPSLRLQTNEASWTHLAKNNPSPPLHFHPHLLCLAEHEEHPPMVRPGPRDRLRGPHVHRLRHPGPLLPLPPPSPEDIPQNAGDHHAVDLLLRHIAPPPRSPEFPSCQVSPPGNCRGGHCHGPHQPQPLPPPLFLHILLRRVQRLLGGAQLRLPGWLVVLAGIGHPHLHLCLSGMVVVRADDNALRGSGQPQSHRRFHGDSDSDDRSGLCLPLRSEQRRVDPGRERARGEPAGPGAHIHDCVSVLRGGAGRGGDAVRDGDEAPVGEVLHRRRGDSPIDGDGVADCGCL